MSSICARFGGDGAVDARATQAFAGTGRETGVADAAINLIGQFPGCTKGQLALGLKKSHSATVRLCERLKQRGLIEIGQADDPRAAALTLTRAGESARQALLAKRNAALAIIVEELDSEQQEALVKLSETLLAKPTTSPMEGRFICRLCDTGICQPAKCPVHSTAHQLLDAPTGAGATAN